MSGVQSMKHGSTRARPASKPKRTIFKLSHGHTVKAKIVTGGFKMICSCGWRHMEPVAFGESGEAVVGRIRPALAHHVAEILMQ